MPRGGQRSGTPGKAYPARSDMHQPVKVAPGGQYGSRTKLEQAQKAVPLPTAGSAQGAPPAPPQAQQGGAPAALPGQLPFDRASARPTEPITAGLPVGAGPGPEALTTAGPAADDVGAQLRALYALHPTNDILRLIELHDQGY